MSKNAKVYRDLAIGGIGLLLTIVGWFFDHATQIGWMQPVVAPSYTRAFVAYERILASRQPLKFGDDGFAEISEVVQGLLTGEGDLSIVELRIPDHAFSVLSTDKGMESAPTITLEVKLRDGRSTSTTGVKDLRPMLRERFLEGRLFVWGAAVFWIGILISATGLGLLVWEARREEA